MLQLRGGGDFTTEALNGGVAALDGHHLHDDLSIEGDLARKEHTRHATTAEFTLDRVRGAECRLQLVAEVVDHEVTAAAVGFFIDKAYGARDGRSTRGAQSGSMPRRPHRGLLER